MCNQNLNTESNSLEEEMTPSTDLPLYNYGQGVGTITSSKLEEISGMAASSLYTDCFWVNNDSGDSASIYLIDLAGRLIATLTLPVTNRDWEAITIADGYIYIGEVGDNYTQYPDKKIYRVAEPTTIDVNKSEQLLTTSSCETMIFNFADTNRDCETMMFDPVSRELVLVSKRESQVVVYTTPFLISESGQTHLIKSCATLDFTLATAGDISPQGDKILVKNYSNIFFWYRTEGQTIAEALSATPITLRYEAEPQGESIVWSTHEDAFYTVSEKSAGVDTVIYKYERY